MHEIRVRYNLCRQLLLHPGPSPLLATPREGHRVTAPAASSVLVKAS